MFHLFSWSDFFRPTLCLFGQPPTATSIDAASFGAKADGTSDDTAAVQKALDAAGQQGGVVRLPAGKYLVAGSLKIPEGVALVGSNQAPVYIEPLIGTVDPVADRRGLLTSPNAHRRALSRIQAELHRTHRLGRPIRLDGLNPPGAGKIGPDIFEILVSGGSVVFGPVPHRMRKRTPPTYKGWRTSVESTWCFSVVCSCFDIGTRNARPVAALSSLSLQPSPEVICNLSAGVLCFGKTLVNEAMPHALPYA